jgi:hypothetical protein
MAIWHTWLGFLGLLCGLVAPIIIRVPVIWSAVVGLAGGIALVTLWNVAVPTPAPCLLYAKGPDILRAYNLSCARDDAERARQILPTK